MDGNEVIWELIKDNFEQGRSHEEMREKTVTLTITIATILVAALAIESVGKTTLDVFGYHLKIQGLIGIILLGLGVFGAFCSQKHYERNRMHIKLAQKFLARLQAQPGYLPFDVSAEFAAHAEAKDWKAAHWESTKLNWLWTGFPLFIAIVGLVLVIGTLTG